MVAGPSAKRNRCETASLSQRLLACVLLLLFSLPFVAPVTMSTGDQASLPACCRREGKHHCAMSLAERLQISPQAGKRWQAPLDRCPFCPSTAAGEHGVTLMTHGEGTLPASSNRHIAAVRAAECLWRVARERARHKRGPPASFSI